MHRKKAPPQHALFNSVTSFSFSDKDSSASTETDSTNDVSAERSGLQFSAEHSFSVSELDPDSLVI